MEGIEGIEGIEALLFDVGGTLLYPCPSVAETFAEIAQRRGHDLSAEQVERHIPAVDAFYEDAYRRDGDFWCSHEGSVGIWLDQYRLLCRLTGIGDDAEGMAHEVHEAYRAGDHWAVFPDARGCLVALKGAGFALGVVSNWDDELENLLCDLDLLPFFDCVAASAALGCRKPDPAIFQIACARLGIPPERCLHVGDHPEADGDGAAAAGIRPLIIDRSRALAFCRHERISSLEEVPLLLGA